jgi:hypothetical protein
MYMLGLKQLGHDVYYLEDTRECNFDPELNSPAIDPNYALKYINESLRPFGLGSNWRYVDFLENGHGMENTAWKEVCSSADLLIVLSGGVWKWREEYLRIPRRVFIDSDPGFTQLAMTAAKQTAQAKGEKAWYLDFFQYYDRLFTFGVNIGKPGNQIPTCGFDWLPTTQPICTKLWEPPALPTRPLWTTIMTWQIQSFAEIGGNKDEEFLKILELPQKCEQNKIPALEIAINGPADLLKNHGWRCTDAMAISADLWRYHAYITSSRGEFSVAKNTYVVTRSGWFSDRTACYLAAGKPAVVQETGLSDWLPTGLGLLTWSSKEEALTCLEQVEADYTKHVRAAREIAREHLEAGKILSQLLTNSYQQLDQQAL